MYTVQVLLSTFNGEEYVFNQIDSILKQKDVNVRLLVRDDGSTDSTPTILREYAKEYENFEYVLGKNHGVKASFFRLFELADSESDFYALADQDDVWDEDKLIIACSKLEGYTLPSLYCCEAVITDMNLNPISVAVETEQPSTEEKPSSITPDFKNALIENIARGGSIVFNPYLLKNIQIPMPVDVYMHDWWLYLVASCFGTVIYDPTPHYKYRQHSGNVLGAASTSVFSRFLRRLRQSKTNGGHISRQAAAFERIYHLPDDKQLSIDVVTKYKSSFKYRVKGFRGKYLYRQSKSDNFIFKLMFFTNHL